MAKELHQQGYNITCTFVLNLSLTLSEGKNSDATV